MFRCWDALSMTLWIRQVCYLHDRRYCNCEKYYTDKGQEPPLSALVAMRSFSYAFSFSPLDSLDVNYYRCVHKADQELIKGFDEILAKNGFPVRWDGFTRYKFVNLLDVFKRNMPLDDVVLTKLEAKEPAYTLSNSKSSPPTTSSSACEPEESEIGEWTKNCRNHFHYLISCLLGAFRALYSSLRKKPSAVPFHFSGGKTSNFGTW